MYYQKHILPRIKSLRAHIIPRIKTPQAEVKAGRLNIEEQGLESSWETLEIRDWMLTHGSCTALTPNESSRSRGIQAEIMRWRKNL